MVKFSPLFFLHIGNKLTIRSPKLLLIVALLFSASAFSQNLVPNNGFDTYTACPSGSSQTTLTPPWFNPVNQTGTPDYMNACFAGQQGVPTNFYGYQVPVSPGGYYGMITYYGSQEVREYITAPLTQPLVAGQTYYVGFYVSLSDNFKYATDHFGAYLSVAAPTWNGTFTAMSTFTPQIDHGSGSPITDMVNWTLISGNYTAAGGEQYITLGNFYKDVSTQAPIVNAGSSLPWAYYYVDEAFVIPLSLKIIGDTTLCLGQSSTLVAVGNGPYTWADVSNQSVTLGTTDTLIVSPTITTTYMVRNNTDTAYITVHVSSLPAIHLGNDTSICNGQSLTLNGTSPAALYYAWSTTATTPTITVNTSGTYWVQATDSICTVGDTIIVSSGISSSTTVNQTICTNSIYTLPNGTTVSNAGTYIDTIPSSGGCDSIITTILTVGAGTVDAGSDAAICAGGSTQLNATGGLIYSWTPATGLSDPNIANPVASPPSSTTYTVSSQIPLNNLIVNGDFSAGNTGFSSGYAYTPPPNSSQGQYWVSTNAQTWNGGMATCGDHTTGTGNMLLVNGATTANVSFWCETVNVVPNTSYAFSTWLATLTASNPAQLQFSINGVLLGPVFTASATNCIWQQFYSVWNSGANTTATICVVNQNTIASGNDFALDDISFAPLCTGTDTVRVTVNPTYTNTVNASICQGGSYTRPNGTIATTNGTYIDTLLTGRGCDSIITTNLVVNPNYTFTLNPTICPTDAYILPDGSVVYTSGTYVTHLQSVNGCDSMFTTNLTVVPSTLVASNDTSICIGSSVPLNASGGLFSYSWTPGATLTDSTIANPVATPTQTTAYIVTSQTASGNLIVNGDFSAGNAGFSSAYSYTTNLYPEATYYVGSNPNNYHSGFSACVDHTTGSGNMMIVNGAGTPNTSVWCETISVLPNTNYAFSCWGESVASGSPAQLQFSINGGLIGPLFTVPFAVCQWQQFYTIWNSGANTSANICIVNQNTSTGGNDFALDDISFQGICSISDTVLVTVHTPDTVTLNPSICSGIVYIFPDGTTSTTSKIDTAHLVNQFGCDSTIITNLTVNPSAQITVFDTICAGTSYTLPSGVSVNTSGIYNDTLPTSGGCDSVVITNLTVNPVYAITLYDTICKGSNFTLPDGNVVSTSGNYPVTLTNRFGCDSVVTNVLEVIDLNLIALGRNILCYGQSTGTISATASGGVDPYNYVLTLNSANVGNNTNGNFNGLIAGSYVVGVTDDFGCTISTNVAITEPAPLLTSANPVADVTCFGLRDGQVTINASGGMPAYTYMLGNQSNSSGNFSSLDTGTYEYVVTDANGCVDSASVSIAQPAAINISITPDSLVINLGKKLQLNATSNYDPNATYLWNPTFGLSCYTCPNPVVSINSSTDYNVSVTVNINGNNCSSDTNIRITVIPDYDIFIPNVFTPNLDGNNDYFQLFGNLPAMKFIDVALFDRWGEKVFESNDIYFKWDGIYKGKPVPPGVFVYTLRVVFDDDHTEKLFTGSVTVLR
ncbi:MAG: domain containing protein [Bacteroidota bacterium]|nr:domain containing protein [Bacteroidota bacterium]